MNVDVILKRFSSAAMDVASDNGDIIEMRAGDIFPIAPRLGPWAGDEPYVSSRSLGGDHHAKHD